MAGDRTQNGQSGQNLLDDDTPFSTADREVSKQFSVLLVNAGMALDRREAFMAYHAATTTLEDLRQYDEPNNEGPPKEPPFKIVFCDCRLGSCRSLACACIQAGVLCNIRCKRGVHHKCYNVTDDRSRPGTLERQQAQYGTLLIKPELAAKIEPANPLTHTPRKRKSTASHSGQGPAHKSQHTTSSSQIGTAAEGSAGQGGLAVAPRPAHQRKPSTEATILRLEREEHTRRRSQRDRIRSQTGVKRYSWMETIEKVAEETKGRITGTAGGAAA
ncbi:hypothetical protein FGG08_005626 [Glutinoglossum americanum]|uniref:Uncharacterized protein n=1 Tax=Glutinoglossum americanum TaxID=1670608 RepID=A0A9P8I6W4_9PEZI|nr:hypothetical protein FGG08_005626 [Glutinoglossum americanum]